MIENIMLFSPVSVRIVRMPTTPFGVLLKKAREQKGWTQERLAEEVGVTYVAIGDWERGKRNPKRGNVQKISSGLGYPLNDMLLAAGFVPNDEVNRTPNMELMALIEEYEGIPDPNARKIALRQMEAIVTGIQQLSARSVGVIGTTESDDVPALRELTDEDFEE